MHEVWLCLVKVPADGYHSREHFLATAAIGRIREFVTAELEEIRQLLKVDVQKAKAEP